jgi:serine protease Do
MKRATVALALLLCGFLAGLVLTGRLRSAGDSVAAPDASAAVRPPVASAAAAGGTAPPAQAATPAQPAAPGAFGLPDFTSVAAQAVRGVINISSVQLVRTSNSPFTNDPFFQYFFGGSEDVFGSQDRRQLSLGSGVIVSPDGYVLTNSHVVGNRVQEITVALGDKRELRARIVGTDPTTDIALVKIDVAGLSVVPWGDSSVLKVGEWVLAIGSPFQLNQTVTLGIVSAVGRANVGFADYEDFIQTDAAINPGNSGGALINSRGQLVGINTGILSQSGGYQGIGFAVPSNLARRVIDDLVKYGEVRRGSVGALWISPVTTQVAEQLGVKDTQGALVTRMGRGSSAFDAGIRPGDVIESFNGQKVEDPSHFRRLLADARIGSTATVGLVREGRSLTIRVSIVAGGS